MAGPTRPAQSRGSCAFCNKTTAKGAMRRHLESCPVRAAAQASGKSTSSGPSLHLTVEGKFNPTYWLHLEAASSATFEDLDQYLRRIWLECCGHLSAFEVGDTSYVASPEFTWMKEESMTERISRVLHPGMVCGYAYDYGSTTHLKLRVSSEVAKPSGPDWIVLLARNEAPDFPCVECGRGPAAQICTECQYETGGWLCAECAEEHECGEEMQLPVVNSPRIGVCGYTGG